MIVNRSHLSSRPALCRSLPAPRCSSTNVPHHRAFPQTRAIFIFLMAWCCLLQSEQSRALAQAGGPTRPQERIDLYGDRLPAGSIARLGTLRFWLGHPISSVAFSPGGENLAAASAGHGITLRVWEIGSGRTVHVLPAPENALPEGNGLRAVVFAPDGRTLAAACDDGCIRIWQWPSGRLARVLNAHERFVLCIAFAPDGKSLASGGEEGDVKLWNVETGKEIRQFPAFRESVFGVVFCTNGHTLAAASYDRTICLWNVATGNEERRFSHEAMIFRVALGPDGKTLAVSERTFLQVQELDTGKEIWRARAAAGDSFRSLAYSPDGKTVASGSESGELGLRAAPSGKEVRRITLRQPVDAVAFSPDGTRIASGGDLMARLWDVATGKEIVSYPTHDGDVHSFAFSPDEKKMAATSDDGILRLWDVATGNELHEFPLGRRGLIGPVAISRDGRVVTWATSTWDGKEGTVRSWEVESGKSVSRVVLDAPEALRPASFAPDTTMIAGAGEKGVLTLLDTPSGKVLHRKSTGNPGRICAVEFSPDGKQVATSGNGGVVEIWETRTLQPVRQFSASRDTILSLAFSPDGREICTGGADAVLRLWTAATGKERWHSSDRPNPDACFIRTVAFSADGRKVAWGGDDQTVRVWDVSEGRELGQFHGHQDGITRVLFSPSSRYLASGSGDGTILIWDTAQASN